MKHQIRIITFLVVLILFNTARAQKYGFYVKSNTVYLYDSLALKVVDSLKNETVNTRYGIDSLTMVSFTPIGSRTDPPSPNVVMFFYDISGGKFKKLHPLKISIKDYDQLYKYDIDIRNNIIVLHKKKGIIEDVNIRIRRRIDLETILAIIKSIAKY